MKNISPVQVWYSGNTITCIYLNAWCTNLVLNTNATFQFQLLDNIQNLIVEGSLLMEGQNYLNWDQDSFAWDWIATQLNLTIIP